MSGTAIALGLALFHLAWAAGAGARRATGVRTAPAWAPLFHAPGLDAVDPPRLAGERAALVTLLVVAAALRLHGLNGDLWIDEVFTLVDSVRLPWPELLADYSSDNNHMLYSVLGKACIDALGETPGVFRLPAAALGVASVWAAWRLTRWLCGPRQALLVAGLLALSYHHVWFSQNARGYTGLLLCTLLSTEMLLRWLQAGRRAHGIAAGVSLALGFGFHLSMAFVALAQGLVVLGLLASQGLRPRDWISALWPLLLAFTLSLQIYALALPELVAFYLDPPTFAPPSAEWKNPVWMLNEIFQNLGVGLALGWLGLILAALPLLTGVVSALRRWPAAAWLFLLPIAITAITLLTLGRNLWPRFFFSEMAFVVMLTVHGAWLLVSWAAERLGFWNGRRLAAAGGVLVLALSSVALPRNYRHPKQDFSGALAFVERARSEGDVVVAVSLAGRIYRRYYAPEIEVAETLPELARFRDAPGRIWVVYTLGGYLRASQPDLWNALERDFEEAASFAGTLGDGWMVVLRERR